MNHKDNIYEIQYSNNLYGNSRKIINYNIIDDEYIKLNNTDRMLGYVLSDINILDNGYYAISHNTLYLKPANVSTDVRSTNIGRELCNELEEFIIKKLWKKL